jgi:hypothetical protein
VPLIKKLVKTFENLYTHISINQVWLLWKSKPGDDFQGWHQDMVEHITNTVVINLGSEDNANDLETGQIRSINDEGLHVSTSNQLEKRDI